MYFNLGVSWHSSSNEESLQSKQTLPIIEHSPDTLLLGRVDTNYQSSVGVVGYCASVRVSNFAVKNGVTTKFRSDLTRVNVSDRPVESYLLYAVQQTGLSHVSPPQDGGIYRRHDSRRSHSMPRRPCSVGGRRFVSRVRLTWLPGSNCQPRRDIRSILTGPPFSKSRLRGLQVSRARAHSWWT